MTPEGISHLWVKLEYPPMYHSVGYILTIAPNYTGIYILYIIYIYIYIIHTQTHLDNLVP